MGGVKLSKEPTQNSTHARLKLGWALALEFYWEVNALASKVNAHMWACASLVNGGNMPLLFPPLKGEQIPGFLQHRGQKAKEICEWMND